MKQGLSRHHHWVPRGVTLSTSIVIGLHPGKLRGCLRTAGVLLSRGKLIYIDALSNNLMVTKNHTDSEQYLRSRGVVRDPLPGQPMGYLEPCLGIATAQGCSQSHSFAVV